MNDLKKSLLSTAAHALELAVCLGVALFIVRFFNLGDDDTSLVVGLVLNALAKFARASELSPIPDYVAKQ